MSFQPIRIALTATFLVASCDTDLPDARHAPPPSDGAVASGDARPSLPDGATVGMDAAHPAPDAPIAAADAPTPTADAPLVVPDSLLPDGPLADAPVDLDGSAPDAQSGPCPGAATGEPDDVCTGDTVKPLAPGDTAVIDMHALAPAGDVDVFGVPLALLCPSLGTKEYAFAVALDADAAAEVHFARFPDDLMCDGAASDAGRSFCRVVTASCLDPLPLPPIVYFEVAAGSAAACLPYTVTLHLCDEGSTCDTCLAP
jgi:hypothetical protein